MERALLGLAENLTAAERSELESDVVLTYVMFGLAIAWAVCLYLRRWIIAIVAFVVECALGLDILPEWLATSVRADGWVYGFAAAFALTGIVALAETRPKRLAFRRRPA
jgi:hypothetical protein